MGELTATLAGLTLGIVLVDQVMLHQIRQKLIEIEKQLKGKLP